jgi:hypothetical protein
VAVAIGTTARTGERCSESGKWEVVGTPSTTVPIAKSNVMPPYNGKAVTWRLVERTGQMRHIRRHQGKCTGAWSWWLPEATFLQCSFDGGPGVITPGRVRRPIILLIGPPTELHDTHSRSDHQ